MKQWDRKQWLLLAGCAIAYTGAYVCRLNLSALIPQLTREFNLSAAQSGLCLTFFSIAYAAGQLANGWLSGRVNPKAQIAIGLAVAVTCNLLVSVCGTYQTVCAAWILNALGQSMLWTPMVVILSASFTGRQRETASFALTATLVVGHLAAWGGATAVSRSFGWRGAFLFCALTTLALSLSALAMIGAAAPHGAPTPARETAGRMPARAFAPARWGIVLFVCLANGYVRDGVLNWSSSILRLDEASGLLALLVPLMNVAGLAGGWWALRRLGGRFRLMLALSCAAALPLVGLLFLRLALPVRAASLGMVYALTYAVNPILTTLIPLNWGDGRRAGLYAGIVECVIYAGSSLAGAAAGGLFDSAGWNGVYLSWLLAMALSAALLAVGRGAAKEGRESF